MRNFQTVLIAVLIAITNIACASTSGRTEAVQPKISSRCAKLEGDEKITCLEQDNEKLLAAFNDGKKAEAKSEEKGATSQPPSPPPPGALGQVQYQAVAIRGPHGHCSPDFDIVVENATRTEMVEVQGENISLCGMDGVEPLPVKAKSGKVRSAFLIPPGVTARYTYLGEGEAHLRFVSYRPLSFDQASGGNLSKMTGRYRDLRIDGPSTGRKGQWYYAVNSGFLHE